MEHVSRKNLFHILAGVLILLLVGSSVYLYYFNPKVESVNKEKEILNQQYLKVRQELDAANKSLDEKNKEIEGLKQARNNATRADVEKSVTSESVDTSSQQSSSIYDHINGSDDFKNNIFNALNLLSAGDSEHFQIVSGQVGTINEYDNFGGYQEKRDIYIGADANAAITASLISHEAQHVYNVYVDGIWSYHTKEQELPCYEAELATAQRLGAPAFFITSVQNEVNYWQSQ